MINEIFSDTFSQKENYLSKIDARIKMLFTALAIILILFSRAPYLPLLVFFLSILFLLSVKVPIKIILFRLISPLGVISVIVILQILFYGTTPLIRFSLFGFHFAAHKEGLIRGFLIAGKAAGSLSLIIFLSLTTPVNYLLGGASWFRISKIWVEIAMITYRYIFVLLDNSVTIRDAQKVRLGYKGVRRSIRSLAELGGTLFIRAYDQSISTYEAMRLRGYNGTNKVFFEEGFKPKDGWHSIIFSIILFLLVMLNLLWS